MNKKELKLEVGKRYVRRDGVVTEPLRVCRSLSYPFYNPASSEMYTDFGNYINETASSPKDLVAEYSQAASPPSDEQVVARFNELVEEQRVAYRFVDEISNCPPTLVSSSYFYELLPAEPRRLKLPDSGYEVEIDGENVKVGCQRFVTANVHAALEHLLNNGGSYNLSPDCVLVAARGGIRHIAGTLSWNDADALLKFLEEAGKYGK